MKSFGRISPKNSVFFVCDIQVESGKVLRIPCIVTEQNPSRLGSTCEEINVETNNVFSKQLFSMYTPEVILELKKHDRKNAVLFGLETHDYHVHIVVDAVSSQRDFDRATALERLQRMGCFLTTSESILFAMIGSADHESFKEISKLAKEYGKGLKDISKPLSVL